MLKKLNMWWPNATQPVARIESIQRKATRYALRHWNAMDYTTRCALLGLDTLDERHRTAQCVFIANLLNSNIDSPELLSAINLYAPTRALRSRDMITLADHRTRFGGLSPLITMCRQFNSICDLFEPGITRAQFVNRLRNSRSH